MRNRAEQDGMRADLAERYTQCAVTKNALIDWEDERYTIDSQPLVESSKRPFTLNL